MIKELQEAIGVSFRDLELSLLEELRASLSKALVECLERLDRVILEQRDKARFEMHCFEKRSVDTILGDTVTFQRRYYFDRETGQYVHLLDTVLELPGYQQISPALAECVLLQSVLTGSYRSAAESIESLMGRPFVSHETVRQTVLRASDSLGQIEMKWLAQGKGKRRMPTLFVEVDGLNVSLQQDKKKWIEERVLTVHEGWEPRTPGSSEYRLKNAVQFRTQGTDFWEEASRFLYALYDIDESTLVVINGDRASWIRKGVTYFPRAMYQIDRFHLVRDLKNIFQDDAELLKRVYEAFYSTQDVTGATFLATVAEARAELRGEKEKQADSLMRDLSNIAEATVDYRLRAKALGWCVDGLRSMGAAESQMDRLSDRVKGRGRSWSREGLGAMMRLLGWRNNGLLHEVARRASKLVRPMANQAQVIAQASKAAADKVLAEHPTVKRATAPATRLGRNRTSGMSRLMHSITSGYLPV